MSRRDNFKRRRSNQSFTMLVHEYFSSPQYVKLSPPAVKLLVDLLCQYRGNNNGDLTTAWTVVKTRGWRSKHLLYKARTELEGRGWILRTRQGGIHAPTLYAVTLFGIDDCRDKTGRLKFDPGVTADPKPLHLWKLPTFDTAPVTSKRSVKRKVASPTIGKPFPGSRTNVTDIRPDLSRLSDRSAA